MVGCAGKDPAAKWMRSKIPTRKSLQALWLLIQWNGNQHPEMSLASRPEGRALAAVARAPAEKARRAVGPAHGHTRRSGLVPRSEGVRMRPPPSGRKEVGGATRVRGVRSGVRPLERRAAERMKERANDMFFSSILQKLSSAGFQDVITTLGLSCPSNPFTMNLGLQVSFWY